MGIDTEAGYTPTAVAAVATFFTPLHNLSSVWGRERYGGENIDRKTVGIGLGF